MKMWIFIQNDFQNILSILPLKSKSLNTKNWITLGYVEENISRDVKKKFQRDINSNYKLLKGIKTRNKTTFANNNDCVLLKQFSSSRSKKITLPFKRSLLCRIFKSRTW